MQKRRQKRYFSCESTDLEVADIFRRYAEAYRAQNKLMPKQHKVMNAIMNCRSSNCGQHVDMCDKCGHIEKEYNSCRDRHCPKCQGISRRKWIEARIKDILPVPYYHVVFTLPHLLEKLISFNKAFFYDLLFSSASETLLAFGRDPKWLGGEVGFHSVLHTWGQKLWRHLHLHIIIPGGAISADSQWVTPRYKGKFLFPVHALSKVFRGKFIEGLKAAHTSGELRFPPDELHLKEKYQFERWIDRLVARKWVVYCKRPFKDPEHVLNYIGKYTHRVAISNQRIIDDTNGYIRFWYKDYKAGKSDGIIWRTMKLQAFEFIRRFMFHVLPSGFHKIRHYGFLANGRRKANVALIKSLIGVCDEKDVHAESDSYTRPCPECKDGFLTTVFITGRFGMIITDFCAFYRQRMVWDSS